MIPDVRFFAIIRDRHDTERTFGRWFYEGSPVKLDGLQIVNLEDEPRETKVPGETRIKAGCYFIGISFSPKFKRDLIYIEPVPDFTGIRVHPGNRDDDTDGCQIPGNQIGQVKGELGVLNSTRSYEVLHKLVFDNQKAGLKQYIMILDAD